MNKSGHDNPEVSQPAHEQARGAIPVWLGLIALVGALVFTFVVGVQIIGALYVLIAPPLPPVPLEVVEMEHLTTQHGSDEWLYGTQADPCAVTAYYAEQGATCALVGTWCEGARLSVEAASVPITTQVATCTHESAASVFTYAYKVGVWAGYGEVNPTRFRVTREVFWGGGRPPRDATLSLP